MLTQSKCMITDVANKTTKKSPLKTVTVIVQSSPTKPVGTILVSAPTHISGVLFIYLYYPRIINKRYNTCEPLGEYFNYPDVYLSLLRVRFST